MATFYFLCYNFSFSGMRGSIAISLLLLDFYYLQHHDYKRAIPLFLFAVLFHNSAILMMAFYCFILMILDSKYPRLWGGIFAICVFLLFLIADKLLWTDPLKLQKQVDILENNDDCSLVISNGIIHNERTSVNRVINPLEKI